MKYFTLKELGAESVDEFHTGFLDELETLRIEVDAPMHVTSCSRSRFRNTSIGGSSKSLHIWDDCQRNGQNGCMAIDVAMCNPIYRTLVVKKALALGWSVGLNFKKGFIHLDRRVDIGEPQVIFGY